METIALKRAEENKDSIYHEVMYILESLKLLYRMFAKYCYPVSMSQILFGYLLSARYTDDRMWTKVKHNP